MRDDKCQGAGSGTPVAENPAGGTVRREAWIWLLMAVAVWVAVLAHAGSLASGYQFTDDHEIVSIAHDLRADGYLPTLSRWVGRDLQVRLRPFYYVGRVTATAVLGTHLALWSLSLALLAGVTSAMLGLFARRAGFHTGESILFVLVALVGPQAAVWWRLGPQESLGTALVAAALLAATARGRHRHAGFVLAASLAALTKESFLVFLPALFLAKLWLEVRAGAGDWRRALRDHAGVGAALGILLLTALVVLWIVPGAQGTGYAGSAGWKGGYGRAAAGMLLAGHLRPYSALLLSGLVALGVLSRCMGRPAPRSWRTEVAWLALVLAAAVGSQVLVYTRSGMFERYYLPLTLAVAAAVAVCLRAARRVWIPLYVVLLVATAGLVAWRTPGAYRMARDFGRGGRIMTAFLQTVESRTTPEASILLVAEPALQLEWALSFDRYMRFEARRPAVYALVVALPGELTPYGQALDRQFRAHFRGRMLEDLLAAGATPDCVAFMPGTTERFLAKPEWQRLVHTRERAAFGPFEAGLPPR